MKKFCETVSCDGIHDLYESRKNNSEFIFWSTVMLTMLSLSALFTYSTIFGYINSPTVTNVATVPMPQLDMPDVLVCYNGGLNVKALKSEGFTENVIKDFARAIDEDSHFSNDSAAFFKSYLHRTKSKVKDLIQKVGYNCTDIIQWFSFPPEYDGTGCTKSEYLLTDKGKCFAFLKNGQQSWPGYTGGMTMTLVQPEDSFYENYAEKDTDLSNVNSFSITLEKQIGAQVTDRSLQIPMNTRTEIILNTKRYVRSINVKGNCNDDSQLYSSNTCFFAHCVERIKNRYNCIPIHYWDETLGKKWNVSVCEPFQYAIDFSVLDTVNGENIDVHNCRPKCDEWVFESTVTFSTLEHVNSTSSKSFVSIAYNTMQYTKIEEVESFTLDMAIANVGGQSGLWLGASIVTIIQTLYFSLLWVFRKLSFSNETS